VRTHYQNLKVPENASQRDIRTAFRRLCHQYHPDKAPGNTEAVRIMQIINDAYEVLSDPARRAEYDQRLRILRMMPGGGEQRSASSWERYVPPGQAPTRGGGGRPPQWPGTGSWRAPGGFDRGQGRRTSYAPPQPESFFGFLLQSFSGRGLLY
jgi:curved DNA-binding protein CbpA